MRRYVLWMSALVSLALAASASAEPVVSVPIDPNSGQFFVVNATGGVPANGALLIIGPYDTPLEASGVGASGPQDGTLTPVESSPYWVWRPSQPFVAGTRFDLQLSTTAGFSSVVTFDIVPAIELAQPPLTLEPSASLLSVISKRACCRVRIGDSATLQETAPCFAVEYESSIQLDPGVSTSASRLLANQYLFRFTTGEGQRPSFADGSLRSTVLPIFREQAERYCFEVTAIELPTLAELNYDTGMSCADHGALGDLGAAATQPGPLDLIRNACQAPPAGLEDAWCEVNAECEDDEDDSLCGLYPHVCEGEPLEPLSVNTSDAGTTTGDGPDEADASTDRPPAGKRGSDGCSVGSTRQAGGRVPTVLGWALLGLILAASARARGRESRARVCHGGA